MVHHAQHFQVTRSSTVLEPVSHVRQVIVRAHQTVQYVAQVHIVRLGQHLVPNVQQELIQRELQQVARHFLLAPVQAVLDQASHVLQVIVKVQHLAQYVVLVHIAVRAQPLVQTAHLQLVPQG